MKAFVVTVAVRYATCMDENDLSSQGGASAQPTSEEAQNANSQQPTVIGPSFTQPIKPDIESGPIAPMPQTPITSNASVLNEPQPKKIILFGVVAALILVLGLGGWLLAKKTSNSKPATTSNSNTEKDADVKISLLDTSSWTVFNSKLYGVSVSLPPNWVALDLPLSNPYPGIIISSPEVSLSQKSDDGKNTGVFSIRIRTSKIVDQTNNFFQQNDVGSLAKCQELSTLKLNDIDYKIVVTAFSLNNTPDDPYAAAPYNNSSLFDGLQITSECVPSRFGDSAGGLKPNFQVDKSGLLLTASANFNTAKPERRGNSSTSIPFSLDELRSNKSLETFSTILSTIKPI